MRKKFAVEDRTVEHGKAIIDMAEAMVNKQDGSDFDFV